MNCEKSFCNPIKSDLSLAQFEFDEWTFKWLHQLISIAAKLSVFSILIDMLNLWIYEEILEGNEELFRKNDCIFDVK
jgi:hypothetical protein